MCSLPACCLLADRSHSLPPGARVTRNRHPGPLVGLLFTLFLTTLFPALPSDGAGLVEMPLKPWTYFELYRDWTYTAIEKLVIAGLVGPWVLNTKPLSRIEMARVVATALRKIQEDQVGRFANRTDLEPVLYDLMEEFAPELEAMAVRNGTDEFAGRPWLSFQPLSHVQARGFYTSQDTNLENSQGLRLPKGFGGTVGFDSTLQIHDYLSGYISPEFQMNEQGASGRVVEGYLKLKYNNLALLFGRESVWWGPGYHGSMMFGNNAAPLDQFRIYSAEPFYLPWFLRYLGPTRMELMWSRMGNQPTIPYSILGSWRVDFSPLSLFEFGLARTVQMGGQGRPPMNFLNYLEALFVFSDKPDSKFNTNQLYTVDGTIRLHDVDRVFPLTRDLSLYAEMEVDDTCCNNVIWPLKPGYMVGLYLPNLFGRNGSELRVEWSSTTSFTWDNGIYTSGLSNNAFPLAHYIGTKGQELYIQGSERVLPNLQIQTELGLAKVGTTLQDQINGPREERNFVGIDISYRPIPALSMLFGYRYTKIHNQNFVPGQRATDQTVRLEATYSFPVFEKGLIGRSRRADALRPGTPPPPAGDKSPPDIDQDEIVSVNYVKRLFQDTGTILTSPLNWDMQDWLIFAGVGAATGGLMFADKPINNFLQAHHTQSLTNIANAFQTYEVIFPAVVLAGMAGTGYAFDRPKLVAAAADALEASLISVGVIAVPMKFFIGRARPDRNLGPSYYTPFYLGSSLPSFTSTNAFAVASVLSEHFPNPAFSILAYGLATAAGLSRMYLDKHWTSDVFLGAAIGTLVGKAVVKLNEQRREKSKVSVLPLLGDGVRGAVLHVEF